jgi:hypothetical protein
MSGAHSTMYSFFIVWKHIFLLCFHWWEILIEYIFPYSSMIMVVTGLILFLAFIVHILRESLHV